jgi:hypothetical protein
VNDRSVRVRLMIRAVLLNFVLGIRLTYVPEKL